LKISTPYFLSLISGFCLTCFSSCEIINPEEGIPAYLKIEEFTLTTSAGQGSSSHRITDVWAYADEQLAGIYEIPKTFPVLDSGSTQLVLSAGIWDNGIAETRVIYPFYFPDTVTLFLEPAKTYTLKPRFTYRPSTKFYFIEDFEAGNIFDQINGDTNMVRISGGGDVFEGAFSSAIYLDTVRSAYEGRSSTPYPLMAGNPAYLELNYKCDQEFEVGLYGTQFGISAFSYAWNINPKENWNKIYLNLGPQVTSFSADEYQILIRAVLDSTKRNQSTIYLDNIKLVSY
jgi:hypothetical protein